MGEKNKHRVQGRRYGLKLTGAIKERCKLSPLKIVFFRKNIREIENSSKIDRCHGTCGTCTNADPVYIQTSLSVHPSVRKP